MPEVARRRRIYEKLLRTLVKTLRLKNSFSTKFEYRAILQPRDNMESETVHIEHVSEPWFSLISLGLKTVEGRKNKGKFKDMQVNDVIEWKNDDFNPRKTRTRITKKVTYQTFEEYLTTEGLHNCLPGMPNIKDGLSVYFKYYTKVQEQQYGVMAIHLELIKD